jgi:hypothetical protein
MLASLLILTACKGLPFFWRTEPGTDIHDPAQAPGQIALEWQEVRYDGWSLSGRLLVGAVGRSLRLDKRLIQTVSIYVRSVSACDSGQPVRFLRMDYFPPRAREKDLLVLEPGYWYGTRIDFKLFDEQYHGPSGGPECIDAELVFKALAGQPLTRMRVRATRTPQPPPGTEGP